MSETVKKKKVGRPKNATIQRLEGKIRNLERQLEALKSEGIASINENRFDSTGIGVDYNPDSKEYTLRIIKYNSTNPVVAKVVDSRKGGDSKHRAMFEMRKFLTHELDLILNNR